jgi:hypothetical protein
MECLTFNSQYAYIEDLCIYIDNYDKSMLDRLKCINGHDLCYANGKKIHPYFRHINQNENPMSEWHREWQSNFENTEITFKKIDKQIKDRRADVLLNNKILEFQYSPIDIDKVNDRKNDYLLHGKHIYWIIYGGNSIKTTKISCNRIYLEFISDFWKYKSFLNYEIIFIDINSEIYKIYPNQVKSNMIDVELPFNKDEFINFIKDGKLFDNIFQLQCNLYIKQQGAGNGKTYGIIQRLLDKSFIHYKCIIMVAKQHSAVHIIYNEFKQQVEDGFLKGIELVKEPEYINKKHVIKYIHEKVEKQIIIGTLDSFMWPLGNINHTELDKFEGIVNSIIDGYIQENSTCFKYAEKLCKLNKEMCLICDEFQDNPEIYIKAIIKIMRSKYIDSYIVGDLLQSISFNENAFTFVNVNDFQNINTIKDPSTNICRRFCDPSLVNFVNEMVPFEKYNLPKITPWKIVELNENNVIVFEGKIMYGSEDDYDLSKEVETILAFYIIEVEKYNRKPNDFLILTPFTTKNPLIVAVETAINEYWVKKYGSDHFERFAVFHKSETGTAINLQESEDKTRIVSIHTSKGDGRPVVFVIGLTENALLKFSGEKNNLIFDSMIHVSITRMKERLYIRVENNGDSIYQKISKYLYNNNMELTLEPYINIPKKIRWSSIVKNLTTNEHFQLLSENIIIPSFNSESKQNIDMYHHNIRYASMLISFYLAIVDNSPEKQQISAILLNFDGIHESITWQNYYKNLKENKLCVFKISNKGKDYLFYYNVIVDFIKNIKNKIKSKNLELCPLECIILYYMISVKTDGVYADISINELYNIIDIYNKSFNVDLPGHTNCKCRIHFKKNSINCDSKRIEEMQRYLLTHYEKINTINNVYSLFMKKNPNIKWNINHTITFNGNTPDFHIYKKFQTIGYDDKNVWIIYIKPQFNELNYNEFVIDSIYNTFFIKNLKIPIDDNKKTLLDYEKYGNKQIVSIVFTSECNDYYSFSWDNLDLMKYVSNSLINNYCIDNLFDFFIYHKNNTKSIIKTLHTKKNETAYFVYKFFEIIGNELKQGRTEYLDKEYFNKELKSILIESINDFLE